MSWTTTDDIVARVRRRWDDGSLLTAYARGEAFPEIDVPLKGPTPREAAEDLSLVQAWAGRLVRGSREGASYELRTKAIGGRVVGRNVVPDRARLTTYAQAWRLLGTAAAVDRFDLLLEQTRSVQPGLEDWVCAHPLRALSDADDWPRTLAAVTWLSAQAGRGRYLREIEAHGVDTKYVAAHRSLLADLLDVVLPPERVAAHHSRGSGFAQRYGFAEPPRMVRLRVDPGFAGLPPEVSEVALRPEELARLRVSVGQVVVVENEVTFLAAPVPPAGVVVWGAGYVAASLGRVPWVREAREVAYSGDLDTHGFAILSALRQAVPQTRSLLMDRATLMAHRDRWGWEPKPTRARLDHLTRAEQALYQELVEDAFAPSLRLEQERLEWTWAQAAFNSWVDAHE